MNLNYENRRNFMTTIQTLFGPEEVRTSKPKSIHFKQIKAVYEP